MKRLFIGLIVSVLLILHVCSCFLLSKVSCICIGAHTHNNNLKKTSICLEARVVITKLMNSSGKYTPKNLIEELVSKGIDAPLLKDLYNFMQRFRNQKLGGSKITLGELSAWCEENITVPIPELVDEPFVVDYETFFPELDGNTENYENGDSFRFFISTRGLPQFSNNSKVIHTDAT